MTDRQQLIKLTKIVCRAIILIDKEMKKPSSVDRGKRMAKIINYLEIANDSSMHNGLGYGFKKISNIKEKCTNHSE